MSFPKFLLVLGLGAMFIVVTSVGLIAYWWFRDSPVWLSSSSPNQTYTLDLKGQRRVGTDWVEYRSRTVVFLFALMLIAVGSCQTSKTTVSSTLQVSLCDLYENPAVYEGKSITVSATVTQLSGGIYLIPTAPCVSGFRFVKLESGSFQSSSLKELASSSVSSSGRKEFEAEITGIFDSKYAEDDDEFRFRIVPSEIKQRSSVKSGRPLGAG